MNRIVCIALLFFLLPCVAAETTTWRRAVDRDDGASLWRLLPTADVSVTNDKGKTALMSAARLGDDKLLAALQMRGLSLSDRSRTGGTVLMYAALGNQLAMIRSIKAQLNDKHYIDAQSTNGWTALMIAAAKGFDQSVKLLVELGADPSLVDAYQWSPLMRAIDNRHRNVVQYLLSLPDIAVDTINENGSTALHVAVQKKDTYAVDYLLRRGIDSSIKDVNGKTAADIARESDADELASRIDNFAE